MNKPVVRHFFHSRRHRHLLAVTITLLNSIWLATTAYAQPSQTTPGSATVLETLLVTARHREEAAKDVPIALSVVGGDELAQQKLDRVSDYAIKLPSFNAVLQNTRVSTLTVRGVGGNANSDGSESSVGLIVDNVFFTHPGFAWLDFVDLESVQLARGPQGTLLGKNTTLGALVVTTQKPAFTPGASVSTSLSENNRVQVRGNATGPISENLAGRITVYYDEGDGWINNKQGGNKLLDTNRWAVRGQLLYEDEQISNRLIGEHYNSEEYNNWYAPVGDPRTFANGAPRPGSWHNVLANVFGYTPEFGLKADADLDNQDRLTSRTNGISNQLDIRLDNGHQLTSVTAWRQLYFRPRNDSDYSPFNVLRAGYDVDVDQYSQELRLASPASESFDYQAGVYFLRQEVSSNFRQIALSDASRWFLAGTAAAGIPAVLNGVELDQQGKTEVNSAAVFGQIGWHITEQLDLTTGIRYTHEKRDASNNSFLAEPGEPLALPALQGARNLVVNSLGGIFQVDDSKSDGSVSWLINPSYRVNDQVLAYLSVSYGEKSGAANLGAKPGDPVIINPESVHDYTLGLKTTFLDGRGYVNPNIYWTRISDYHASAIDPGNGRSYLNNVGEVHLHGVELEAGLPLGDYFTLNLSAAYNDAEYDSYKNAPVPLEYRNTQSFVDLSGTRFPSLSRVTGHIGLSYDQQLPSGIGLFGYINQGYRSETFLHYLSEYARQDAYSLTHAGIGLRSPDDFWSVQLWVRNLFDKRYAVGFGAASAVNPYVAVLGEPRVAGITLTLKL